MKRGQKQTGFTIVELLIVIVVIGILAAITTVAFGNIQVKSQNTTHFNAAKQAVRLVTAYKASSGTYPTMTSCVGRNFIDYDNDGVGECWDSTCNVVEKARNDFNLLIESVGRMNGEARQGFRYEGVCGTQYMTGPVYSASDTTIRYWQRGSCPEGTAVWVMSGLSQCSIGLPL